MWIAKKAISTAACIFIFICLNTTPVEPGISVYGASTDDVPFANMCNLLSNLKPGDLSFCIGYIKNSAYTSSQIANFIVTWSPNLYRKKIPAVFISKLDRLIKLLQKVEYQQLIIEIDIVKSSQLTAEQIVKKIKSRG